MSIKLPERRSSTAAVNNLSDIFEPTDEPRVEEVAPLAVEEAASNAPAGARMYLGGIPKGTSENLIVTECSKYGHVTSIDYSTEHVDIFEGGWALVTFAAQDSASTAVQRLSRRLGLFGATQQMEIRLANDNDSVRAEQRKARPPPTALGAPDPSGAAPMEEEPANTERAPPDSYEDRGFREPRREHHSERDGDRRGGGRRSRGRRHRRCGRSRSRGRRRRRQGPESEYSEKESEAEENGARQTALAPIEPVERAPKVRGLGGFDATNITDAAKQLGTMGQQQSFADMPSGGRQVGTRGCWAEFATPDSRSYYVNILTGEKQWARPVGYDVNYKRRGPLGMPIPSIPGMGHSNVYVGSLPAGINDVGFRQLVQPFGNIISIKVEQFYAFVKYSSVEEAQRCIDVMNGSVCNGVQLQVRFANKDRG